VKIAKTAVGTSIVIFALAAVALLLVGDPSPEPPAPVQEAPVDSPEAPVRKEWPRFTAAEVAEHNHIDSCWLIIHDRVYDVTSYIPRHPAPLRTITDYCGGESTEAFRTKEHLERDHRRSSYRLLEQYRIGNLEQETPESP
jgi:cytochrome b involved in lipid metabolism